MTVGKFVGSLVLGRRFPYPKPRRKNGLVFGQSITCHVFDSLQWVEAHEFFVITCMEFLGTRDHLLPIAWGGGGGGTGDGGEYITPPPPPPPPTGGWGGIHEPRPLLLLVSHPPQKANVTISFLSPYPPIPLSPHTDRLKIYYSVVKQIHESALCSKRGGFKLYLPQNSKHDGS